MVANGHQPPPPIGLGAELVRANVTKAMIGSSTTVPRLSGCRFKEGKILVNITTRPQQAYLVQALDRHRVVQATRSLIARGNSATVEFDVEKVPNPIFFRVTLGPPIEPSEPGDAAVPER